MIEAKPKFVPKSRAQHNMGALDYERYNEILIRVNRFKGLCMSEGDEYLSAFVGSVYELYDEWHALLGDETRAKAEALMVEIERSLASASKKPPRGYMEYEDRRIVHSGFANAKRNAYSKIRELHRLLMWFRQHEAKFGMKVQTQQSPSAIARRAMGIPDKVKQSG